MGLFDFLKKKNTPGTSSKTSATAPKQQVDRLTDDGRLPGQWYLQNKDFTRQAEANRSFLLQEVSNTWHGEPRRHLGALKSYVCFMRETEELCRSRGECFFHWFNEYFAVGGYAEDVERYEYYRDNIDQLDKDYKRKKQIQKQILEIIKETPNILQTDVYKKFAPEEKGFVSSELYRLADNGTIERIKSGRTYSLQIKNEDG